MTKVIEQIIVITCLANQWFARPRVKLRFTRQQASNKCLNINVTRYRQKFVRDSGEELERFVCDFLNKKLSGSGIAVKHEDEGMKNKKNL